MKCQIKLDGKAFTDQGSEIKGGLGAAIAGMEEVEVEITLYGIDGALYKGEFKQLYEEYFGPEQ